MASQQIRYRVAKSVMVKGERAQAKLVASRLAPIPLRCNLPHAGVMTDPLRSDLNDFLFTRVADDANGMHLTMLSALARSGVDPWDEAAELASLPRDNAAQKLEHMLANVPNGPSPGDATATLAASLVAQLHLTKNRRVPSAAAAAVGDKDSPPSFAARPKGRLAVYAVVVLILILILMAVAG